MVDIRSDGSTSSTGSRFHASRRTETENEHSRRMILRSSVCIIFLWSHQVDVHTCRRTRDGSILACLTPALSSEQDVLGELHRLSASLPKHQRNTNIVVHAAPFPVRPYRHRHTNEHFFLILRCSSTVERRTNLNSNSEGLERNARDSPCDCQYYTQPCFLRHRYDIDQYNASPSTNTTLSIIGLLDQYINDDDTRSFSQLYRSKS